MASRKAIVNELHGSGLISEASATSLQNDESLGLISGQGSAVADASGGATVDAEARTAINDLLAELRSLGIIAT